MLYAERQSPVEVTAQYFAAETRHAKDQVDRQIRKTRSLRPAFQKFTDGWGTTTGGTIKFEITAKNIGMIYYMTVDGQSGVAAVKVDGEDVATINADFTSGWGNYAKAQQIYSSDEVATHTVEVTVVDDAKPNFQILNWLIS